MATFYNQATLSYSNGTVNSNTVSGELLEVLAATKNSVQSNYAAGDTITYVINITNSGSTALTGLTLTDNLGAYSPSSATTQTVVPLTYQAGTVSYYSNGVLQNTPVVTGTNPLTITGITVPAGGNVTLLYNATVNRFAPLTQNSQITNTVSVTGPGVANEVTAEKTLPVANTPNLSISKAISPNVVSENGTITYTFNVMNYGNTEATAADNIIITDTFNPVLSNITVNYNNAVWAPTTNYTYDTTTGLFETVAGQITVPAATYTTNPTTGEITVTPGVSTLTITGTV